MRTVQAWLELAAQPQGPLARALRRCHGLGSGAQELLQRLLDTYQAVLRKAEASLGRQARGFLVRAPARVNLMGMHIDHRGGSIHPIALLETVVFVSPREDDRVILENVDPRYEPRSFSISRELPRTRVLDWEAWTREQYAVRSRQGCAGDWGDYVKAAILYYQNRHKGPTGQAEVTVPGLHLFFGSIVPPAAGLSSSSAMVVATLTAALALTGEEGQVEVEERIDWCGDAEWYVGTRGGKGDHASILCGRPGAVLHLSFFPTRVRAFELPADETIVLAHSRIEAKKSAGARDFFNQRIAGYVIGEHLLKKIDPARLAQAPNLASCTPRRAGYPETDLYRMLQQVPERMTRLQALAALPASRDSLERIFDSHADPANGYEVRQILLFGLAEVERSDRGPEVLERQDVRAFGELMNLSHEGDRLVRHRIGSAGQVLGQERIDHRVPDELLDSWIRSEQPLWRLPGGYDASLEELDLLVDLASSVRGVHGARLIGAGRGGCVGMLCEREAAPVLLERLCQGYYRPRGLPEDAAFVVSPCQGAGSLEP